LIKSPKTTILRRNVEKQVMEHHFFRVKKDFLKNIEQNTTYCIVIQENC